MRPDAALATLATNFQGSLVRPGDAPYDEARRVWNGAFHDRRPALLARCADTADVAAALRYARSQGGPIAVRGGGHSLPGFSTCEGGVVIDLSPMKEIHVDPVARTARARAGVLWGELDRATERFGLATVGGQISHTGIAGLTLGGGMGWLMRKFGLAIDNLLEVEMVTPDGRVVRASATENADLFWGLRGGGGNFGIATSFTYRLHPVGTVVGGPMLFALDDAEAALRAWRDWTADLPDEMGTFAILATPPPAPFVPAEHVGRAVLAIVTCFVGDEGSAKRVLDPLRAAAPSPFADLVHPMPYTVLQSAVDATVPHGRKYYIKAGHLGALSDQAIAHAVSEARDRPTPGSEIHFGLLGGAVARVPEDATAYPGRGLPYTMLAFSGWEEDDLREPCTAWVRRVYGGIEPWAAGAYLNHLGEPDGSRVAATFGPTKLARLAALKEKYDPENLLRLNQNITPARPA